MTYIIQNRIVRNFTMIGDFSEQLKRLIFPSQRNEHQKPLRDHIILADEQYYSFAENKKL